jgi:exodeoxyribonuclease VII small subunit
MPPRNNKEQPTPEQLSFEQALAELEAIVAAMERGEVPLAESLEQYERGVQMIKRCRVLLAQAEKKIELLGETDKGEPVTEPLAEPEEPEDGA